MTLSERIIRLLVFSFIIAALCLLCSGNVQAASLRIDVQGDLIDLQAEKVPLIDVVRGVCERTGITLKSSDPMTELLSRELKGLSVEKSLRRLLTHRNYALIFEGKGDNQSVLRLQTRRKPDIFYSEYFLHSVDPTIFYVCPEDHQ